MARSDAAPLITLADKIAREGACAQARDIRALSAHTIALVNARRVPAALQEPLSSGVNALVEQTPPCLPAVPAATVTPPAPTPERGRGRKQPKHRHDRHGHDKGRD